MLFFSVKSLLAIITSLLRKNVMAKISRRKFNYRVQKNESRLENILDSLDIHGSDRTTAKKFLQGKNGLHTKKTLDRVRTIERQIKKGTFNLRRRMSHSYDYKEAVKKFVLKNPLANLKDIWKSPKKVFQLENRTEFYWDMVGKNGGEYTGTSIQKFNDARKKGDNEKELWEADAELQNDYNDFKGNSEDPTDTLEEF